MINKSKTLYKPLASFVGDGLITSSESKWHHHRKLINPTFSHNVLLSFVPIFNDAAHKVQFKLDKLVGQGECELRTFFQKMSLNVALGKDDLFVQQLLYLQNFYKLETTMGKNTKEASKAMDSKAFQYK